jgi:Xaa-Pro aminopeptidase
VDPVIQKDKLGLAIQELSKSDIDLWLVLTREDNLDPISEDIGAESVVGQSAFLFTKEGEKIAIVANFDAEGIRTTNIYDSILAYEKEGLPPLLTEEIARIDPQKIALDISEDEPICDGLTVGFRNILERIIPSYVDRFISAEDVLTLMRSIKTEEEIARTRKAVNITVKILAEVSEFTKLEMSEVDVANFVKERMVELNVGPAWPKEICPSVTIGSHPAGHLGPQDQYKLKRGDLMRLDFGVKYKEYCADVQRVYFALEHGESSPPERLCHMFETASASLDAGLALLNPGARGIDVDAAARKVVIDAGYPEYIHAYGHSLGRATHGVGPLLGPHWPGRYARSKVYRVIQENQIFTAEPSVAFEGVGWINLEDDVIVRKNGVERLSGPQEDFFLIE